jgi:hypothetical protein
MSGGLLRASASTIDGSPPWDAGYVDAGYVLRPKVRRSHRHRSPLRRRQLQVDDRGKRASPRSCPRSSRLDLAAGEDLDGEPDWIPSDLQIGIVSTDMGTGSFTVPPA